jgi:hypothetical protein
MQKIDHSKDRYDPEHHFASARHFHPPLVHFPTLLHARMLMISQKVSKTMAS